MKSIVFLVFLVFFAMITLAQKPALQSDDLGKWPELWTADLSVDGMYFSCEYSEVGTDALLIGTTEKGYQREFKGIKRLTSRFSNDSRFAVFQKMGDTLCIFLLKENKVEYIGSVTGFTLVQYKGKSLLCYETKSPAKSLVIRDLQTNLFYRYDDVESIVYSNNLIAIVRKHKNGDQIDFLKPGNGKIICSWQGGKTNNHTFHNTGGQFAFAEYPNDNNKFTYRIWNANPANKQFVKIADDTNFKGMQLKGALKFNRKGTGVYLTVLNPPNRSMVKQKVRIWKYTDVSLQEEDQSMKNRQVFSFMVWLERGKIVQLTDAGQTVINSKDLAYSDDYVLVNETIGDIVDHYWHPQGKRTFYIVSTFTGVRRKIVDDERAQSFVPILSPNGEYVLLYDYKLPGYLSINTRTSEIINLTKGLNVSWTVFGRNGMNTVDAETRPIGVVGWIKGTQEVLINSKFDLWKVDLTGKAPATNLTASVNPNSNLAFSIGFDESGQGIFSYKSELVAMAFDLKNKQQGFYMIDLKTLATRKIGMYDALFTDPSQYAKLGRKPIMGAAGKFIVMRETSTDFANCYLTTDFKMFTPLSAFAPQLLYNGLRSELVNWKDEDGNPLQGILYKPENFDPNKKYPLIASIYDRVSDELNAFNMPEHSKGGINLSYFVSNGYLVFRPDINFKVGDVGGSYLKSVVSGINRLKLFHYVDTAHIGLSGTSFGGYGVNYIVTHTNIFAAAVSSAGSGNLISQYGDVWGTPSISKMGQVENGQYRMGGTIWEIPDKYISNSSIFNLDRVNTPLLIIHNRDDRSVSFTEGFAIFSGLRRLQKPSWMLEYEGEGHTILKKDNQIDCEYRLLTYFNYYLKGDIKPVWLK